MTDERTAALMAQARAEVSANAAHMKATTKRGDWVTWSECAHLVIDAHEDYVTLACATPDDDDPYETGDYTWEVVEPLGDIELDDDDRAMEQAIIGSGA